MSTDSQLNTLSYVEVKLRASSIDRPIIYIKKEIAENLDMFLESSSYQRYENPRFGEQEIALTKTEQEQIKKLPNKYLVHTIEDLCHALKIESK